MKRIDKIREENLILQDLQDVEIYEAIAMVDGDAKLCSYTSCVSCGFSEKCYDDAERWVNEEVYE